MEVPADTLPDREPDGVGGDHAGARVTLGRAQGDAGRERARRVEQAGALRCQIAGRGARGQDGGQDVAQRPAEVPRRDQRIERRHPGGIPVPGDRVDGEHAGRLVQAHHVLAGEPPVDVRGQRLEMGQLRQVRLAVEDGLVEVGDAPALRHREVQERRQLGAGGAGDVVAPRAERDQQVATGVEGDVAVHHPADAEGGDGPQLRAVAGAHVLDERRVAGREALPDVRHVVRPDAVPQLVLPRVRAGRQRGGVGGDQGGLDPGRPELDAKNCSARLDELRHATRLFVHSSTPWGGLRALLPAAMVALGRPRRSMAVHDPDSRAEVRICACA